MSNELDLKIIVLKLSKVAARCHGKTQHCNLVMAY